MLDWKALTVQELTWQWVFRLAKSPGGDLLLQICVFSPSVAAWLEYPNTSFLMHKLSCSIGEKIIKLEWLFIKVHRIEIYLCVMQEHGKCVLCFSPWRIPWLWPYQNPCPSFSKPSSAWWSTQDHLECLSLERARGLNTPKPLEFRVYWHRKC